MLVPLKKRAEAIADYSEQKHWKNEPEGGKKRRIEKGFLRKWTPRQEEESKARQTRPFEADELKEAIKMSKKGKEPGPDHIRMELIRGLDKNNWKLLLNTMNGWWQRGVAPEELFHARVASIYKKRKQIQGGKLYTNLVA